MPKLSDNMDPEDARALRSYLYQMQEQLQYVLTNLDTENMSDTLRRQAAGIISTKGEIYGIQKEGGTAAAGLQTQAQPAAQSTYSTEGLDSRAEVEKAMANASYRPSQQVTDAADALKQWQQNRPADYQSSYQDGIETSCWGSCWNGRIFSTATPADPLYRQYEQLYTQNAHNASADAAAQAAALTGGYGSSYATSAAQQAYQQQIGGLASAIPTLYSLALDTYQSGGEELVTRLDQLNGQEQNAQSLYDRQLQDDYTQLQQKGDAYNNAYAKDYGQYQEHLNRLDTLHGYYTAQEQAQISQRQQAFNNVMTVLGVMGDVVQLAISGTTGLGSLSGQSAEHRVQHLLRQPRVRGRACRYPVEPADAGEAASGRTDPAAVRQHRQRACLSGRAEAAGLQQ